MIPLPISVIITLGTMERNTMRKSTIQLPHMVSTLMQHLWYDYILISI